MRKAIVLAVLVGYPLLLAAIALALEPLTRKRSRL